MSYSARPYILVTQKATTGDRKGLVKSPPYKSVTICDHVEKFIALFFTVS